MNPYIYYSANILPYWYYVIVKRIGPSSNEFITFAVIDDFGNLKSVNPFLRDVMEDDRLVWSIEGNLK